MPDTQEEQGKSEEPEQLIPRSEVEKMLQERESQLQARFNPDLDRKRNELQRALETRDTDLAKATEELAAYQVREKTWKLNGDAEALAKAHIGVETRERTLRAAQDSLRKAQEAFDNERHEWEVQHTYGVNADWIKTQKAAGKSLAEIVLLAGQDKLKRDLDAMKAKGSESVKQPTGQPGGGMGSVSTDISTLAERAATGDPEAVRAYRRARGI